MSYDLRSVPWLPLRRASGQVNWASPDFLTAGIADDPVVALATPRPDFDAACLELLVGLITLAFQPADEAEWRRWWNEPPTFEEVHSRVARLPNAFDLDGDGPRFLQDIDRAELENGETARVEQLLIEAPGDQTIRNNADLFVKRSRVERLGRPAAAMALITLQTYAPSGGKGHRTSIRGGGPLTTLADPRPSESAAKSPEERSLWRLVWANVETRKQWQARSPARDASSDLPLFPWLEPTRVSNPGRGASTTASDAHPLQCYFGMPRRIRLAFGGQGPCDLTGRLDERTVVGFWMVPYGVQYERWQHPLSPYYQQGKDTSERLPVHGQPGGVGWRDWLGLTLEGPTATRYPAATMSHFVSNRGPSVGIPYFDLRVFGYDLDNMKARDWIEARLPAFALGGAPQRQAVAYSARCLTTGADAAASALVIAVEVALFQRRDDARGDRSYIRQEFWSRTQTPFFAALRTVLDCTGGDPPLVEIHGQFRIALERAALAGFDEACPMEAIPPNALRRAIYARYNLLMTLRGYSKLGVTLFTNLGLAPPEKGRRRREPGPTKEAGR